MREYRESYEHSDSSNKVLWIVLAIVGGVMMVGVLVCGGIGYLFYQALQGARTSVAQAQAQMQVAMEQQVPDLDLKDEDYAKARADFKTKLVRKGPAPQQWKQLHPPADVEVLDFKSGNLSLKAWVNPPSKPGKRKLPGVLFLHGGYAFDDQLIWDAVTTYSGGRVAFSGWLGPDLGVIDSELEAGRPVVAEVRLSGNQHFVLLTGYASNGGLEINDPWFADSVNFADRYGDPASGIVSIRTFMAAALGPERAGGRVSWLANAIDAVHLTQ